MGRDMDRQYDVIVAGAGPAGTAAAIDAARQGAKTLLIEKNPFAGGTWTAGSMSVMLDHANKAGFMTASERASSFRLSIPAAR